MSYMYLDYTPNEKKLLSYIKQGYRPVSCDHPEEELQWRKKEYSKLKNSIYTEDKIIARIRELEKYADEAAGKELQRIYARSSGNNSYGNSSYDNSSNDNSSNDSSAIKYLFLAIVFFALSVATGGIGGIVGYILYVICRKFLIKYEEKR